MKRILLSLLPLVAVACAAQPPAAATITETSRISRVVAGPGDRPMGALLRNGTFVTFTPGLAQQLPATLSKNAPVQVSGEQLAYRGSRTVQARTLRIAGVSYTEAALPAAPQQLAGGPGRVAGQPPLPGVPPPPPPPDDARASLRQGVMPPAPPAPRTPPQPPSAARPDAPPTPLGAAVPSAPVNAPAHPPALDGIAPPPPADNAVPPRQPAIPAR